MYCFLTTTNNLDQGFAISRVNLWNTHDIITGINYSLVTTCEKSQIQPDNASSVCNPSNQLANIILFLHYLSTHQELITASLPYLADILTTTSDRNMHSKHMTAITVINHKFRLPDVITQNGKQNGGHRKFLNRCNADNIASGGAPIQHMFQVTHYTSVVTYSIIAAYVIVQVLSIQIIWTTAILKQNANVFQPITRIQL